MCLLFTWLVHFNSSQKIRRNSPREMICNYAKAWVNQVKLEELSLPFTMNYNLCIHTVTYIYIYLQHYINFIYIEHYINYLRIALYIKIHNYKNQPFNWWIILFLQVLRWSIWYVNIIYRLISKKINGRFLIIPL